MNKREQKTFITGAIAASEQAGSRLTEPRRLVLEIIAGAGKPLGAYHILDELSRRMDNPKPPTAYRAIEHWLGLGVIHRIASLNAYMPCRSDHRHEGSQFMICHACGTVVEAHLCELPQPLAEKAGREKFSLTSWNVELHGTCRKCL